MGTLHLLCYQSKLPRKSHFFTKNHLSYYIFEIRVSFTRS